MSTIPSIPWMPERAWTTARAKCAISGITRSGFTPDHVQLDIPCEASCLPAPSITWVWEGSWDDHDPFNQLCLLDLDDGSFGDLAQVTQYQIWDVRDGLADRLIAGGATMAACCFTPDDWGYIDGDTIHCYMGYFWDADFECGGFSYDLPLITITEGV